MLRVNAAGPHEFAGTPLGNSRGTPYGGLTLAHAALAADLTVGPALSLTSLSARFLAPGDASRIVLHAVEEVHSGRSVASRRVVSHQNDTTLVDTSALFQRRNLANVEARTDDATEVDATTWSIDDLPGPLDDDARRWLAGRIDWSPFEVRFPNTPPLALQVGTQDGAGRYQAWLRPRSPLAASSRAALQTVLVFASDLFLLSAAAPTYGPVHELQLITLSHAMWFHEAVLDSGWVLCQQELIWSRDGQVCCRGSLHDTRGRLLATTVQEGIVRTKTREGGYGVGEGRQHPASAASG